MEQEQQISSSSNSSRWEGYVDWRNKPAFRGRHGGMVAASFVLVVEVLENLAYLANASNLVMYLSTYMHLSPSKAANNVTDFMGTAFLLALLGGLLLSTAGCRLRTIICIDLSHRMLGRVEEEIDK